MKQIKHPAASCKLRQALAAHCYDGTELHRLVDRELRGIENKFAAEKVKHAIKIQYCNSIAIDAVIESSTTPNSRLSGSCRRTIPANANALQTQMHCRKENDMRKSDACPTKYFRAADLPADCPWCVGLADGDRRSISGRSVRAPLFGLFDELCFSVGK